MVTAVKDSQEPRTADRSRPPPLAALPFRIERSGSRVDLVYEDRLVLPDRILALPYRLPAGERPGRQVLLLMQMYRELEADFARQASELEAERRARREAEHAATEAKARAAELERRSRKG